MNRDQRWRLPNIDKETVILFGGSLMSPMQVETRRGIEKVIVPVWSGRGFLGQEVYRRLTNTRLFYCDRKNG